FSGGGKDLARRTALCGKFATLDLKNRPIYPWGYCLPLPRAHASVKSESEPRCGVLLDDGVQRIRGFLVGTWLSLVEHSLGVRGVGSSNLPVPTNSNRLTISRDLQLYLSNAFVLN